MIEGLLGFGGLSTEVEKIKDISVQDDTAEVTVDVKIKVSVFLEQSMTIKITLAEAKEGAFTRDWYIFDMETVEEAEEPQEEGVEL